MLRDSPFGRAVLVARVRGIEVLLHWSVLGIFGLLVWMLATSVLPQAAPGEPSWRYVLAAVTTSVVFLIGLLAHELAHAVTALRQGQRVTRITLWMLGGLTEMQEHRTTARRAAQVAAAGPLTSILLGVVCAGAAVIDAELAGPRITVMSLAWLAGTNLTLAAFNLVPAFPLDGGRLFEALLWWRWGDRVRSVRVAARAGTIFGSALVGFGTVSLLGGAADGLWLGLVGLFVIQAAKSETLHAAVVALEHLPIQHVMTPVSACARPEDTIAEFVASLSAHEGSHQAFPVVDEFGSAQGLITWGDLVAVPRQARRIRLVREAMHQLTGVAVCTPDQTVGAVLEQLQATGWAMVLVNGQPIGTVDLPTLLKIAHDSVGMAAPEASHVLRRGA